MKKIIAAAVAAAWLGSACTPADQWVLVGNFGGGVVGPRSMSATDKAIMYFADKQACEAQGAKDLENELANVPVQLTCMKKPDFEALMKKLGLDENLKDLIKGKPGKGIPQKVDPRNEA